MGITGATEYRSLQPLTPYDENVRVAAKRKRRQHGTCAFDESVDMAHTFPASSYARRYWLQVAEEVRRQQCEALASAV